MKKVLNLAIAIIVTSLFVACSEDNNTPTVGSLTLNLDGLEELGNEYVYEGWLIVNGNPVSTGVFSSVSFPQSFDVDLTDLSSATTFVLSIEPAGETGADALAPADTKILVGDFNGNSASVSSNGIVGDFTNALGKYILATPTDTDDTNESSGVWFLDNSNAPPAVAGLSLPTLSAGWKYEGWVVLNGFPVSTGTFLAPTGADDNATTSPYKGTTSNGPGFPGEDYIIGSAAGVNFPTDLKGATIVISVEPYPDNSPAPFTLKPLAHMVPANALDHTVINMGVGPISVLSGTVSR